MLMPRERHEYYTPQSLFASVINFNKTKFYLYFIISHNLFERSPQSQQHYVSVLHFLRRWELPDQPQELGHFSFPLHLH